MNGKAHVAVISATIIAVTWVFVPWFERHYLSEKWFLCTASAIVLAFLWTTGRLPVRWRRGRGEALRWALAYVVIGGIAALAAIDPWTSASAAIRRSIPVFIGAIVAATPWTVTNLRVLLGAVTLAGAGVALYGLAQTFGLDPVRQSFEGMRLPISTLGHKNYAGEYLAATIPLAAGAWVLARTRQGVTAVSVSVLLMTAHLVLTRSRGAWVGMVSAAVLATLVVLARRGVRMRQVCLLGSLILGGIFMGGIVYRNYDSGVPLLERVRSIADPTSGTAANRIALWKNTLFMIKDHPWLGVGPAQFGVHYPRYHRAVTIDPEFSAGSRPANPHNQILEIAVETGLPSLALLAAFLILLGRTAFRAFRGPSAIHCTVATAAGAGIVACLGAGLFSFPLANPATALLFWVSAGLIVASDSFVDEEHALDEG